MASDLRSLRKDSFLSTILVHQVPLYCQSSSLSLKGYIYNISIIFSISWSYLLYLLRIRRHVYFVLLIPVTFVSFLLLFLHLICHSFSKFWKRILSLTYTFSLLINAFKPFHLSTTSVPFYMLDIYVAFWSFFSSKYFQVSILVFSLMNRLFTPEFPNFQTN